MATLKNFLNSIILITCLIVCSGYKGYLPQNTVEVKFPVGSCIKATLLNNISSEMNKKGDAVVFIISYDLSVGEITAIPRNSRLIGHIENIGKAAIGMNGMVQIIIDELIIYPEQKANVLGHIYTKKNDGIVGGELTRRTGQRKVVHRIEGIGKTVQLIPDGERGKGKELILSPGTEFTIVLDKDLDLTVEFD